MVNNFFIALLSTSILGVFADTDGKSSSNNRLQNGLNQLEQMYVQDCQDDPSPHGYYGAFFQPCEFSFFQSTDDMTTPGSTESHCSPNSFIGTRKPVHWLFEWHKHLDKDDWDNLTSNNNPDWDDLMLWPDQCVGVSPRCYSIRDMSSISTKSSMDIMNVLLRLLPDEIPDDATHVQVDCRSDAMELSRIAFSIGNGLQKGLAVVIAMIILVLFLIMALVSLCFYGCFRLCFSSRHERDNMVPVYHVVPAESEYLMDGMRKSLKSDGLELASSKHYQAVAI